MSKIMNELTEAATTRAMSIAELVEWHQSRARCCRCRWLDDDLLSCGNPDSEMHELPIEHPAKFGCIYFGEAI